MYWTRCGVLAGVLGLPCDNGHFISNKVLGWLVLRMSFVIHPSFGIPVILISVEYVLKT